MKLFKNKYIIIAILIVIFILGSITLYALNETGEVNLIINSLHGDHHHGHDPHTGFGEIVLYAFLAGIVGTGLGGLITILIKKPNKTFIGLSFAFSAALLLTLVFLDLIPHAIGHGHYHGHGEEAYWVQHGAGLWLTILGVVIGIGIIFILKIFDKHGHEHVHGILPHNEECSHEIKGSEKNRLLTSAIIIAAAIILHDFPKGLAIGASGSILMATAIGLAHIPEGMTIAMPLKAVGVKSWKILGTCILAGLATMFGAMIGYAVGGINETIAGMMFAVAAGCIIGVVFLEILPLSYKYAGKNKFYLLAITIGVLVVLIMNYYLHDFIH